MRRGISSGGVPSLGGVSATVSSNTELNALARRGFRRGCVCLARGDRGDDDDDRPEDDVSPPPRPAAATVTVQAQVAGICVRDKWREHADRTSREFSCAAHDTRVLSGHPKKAT